MIKSLSPSVVSPIFLYRRWLQSFQDHINTISEVAYYTAAHNQCHCVCMFILFPLLRQDPAHTFHQDNTVFISFNHSSLYLIFYIYQSRYANFNVLLFWLPHASRVLKSDTTLGAADYSVPPAATHIICKLLKISYLSDHHRRIPKPVCSLDSIPPW